MEFLVRIQVGLPVDMPAAERERLLEAEAARARELMANKNLLRIWRVPGRQANVSLYEATDATELHGIISSLPLWPWIEVRVEPLATHPLEVADG
jgi:muconolactone D-isomerase